MNSDSSKNRDEALLDAVLHDPAWAEANRTIKAAALAEFQAAQRRRHFAYFAQAAAIILLAGGVIWWARPTQAHPQAIAAAKPTAKSPNVAPSSLVSQGATALADAKPADPHYISEQELVAMFPKGSCAIVVLDGKQELVFLDPAVEQEGAAYHAGSPL